MKVIAADNRPFKLGGMELQAPTSIRETIDLLIFYNKEPVLDDVLSRIDWSDVTPAQIYHSVLDRFPESKEVCIADPDYSAKAHFWAALKSEEFQISIVRLLLRAFPQKRRQIFVHVPKCAGTDLIASIGGRYPFISPTLVEENWTTKDQLFSAIKDFLINNITADEVFLGGHIPLSLVVDGGYARYGDEIFTVIRDPVDRVISAVNYLVWVLIDQPDSTRRDRLEWIENIDFDVSKIDPSTQGRRGLARKILFDKKLIIPNEICVFLGDGDAESAIDLIVRSDIEVTDTLRYEAWLQSRWGISGSARLNSSPPIMSRENLTQEELSYIQGITSEDDILYRRIMACLDGSNTPSVKGYAIGEHC